MSYILQALERSERQRQQREPQALSAVRPFIAEAVAPKRSLFGPAALAVAVLALAIAVYGAVTSPLGKPGELAGETAPAPVAATPPTAQQAPKAAIAGQAATPAPAEPPPAASAPAPKAAAKPATRDDTGAGTPQARPRNVQPEPPPERVVERKTPIKTAAVTRPEPAATPTRKREQATPSKKTAAKKKALRASPTASTPAPSTVAAAPEPAPATIAPQAVPEQTRTVRRAPEPDAAPAPSPYDAVPGLASLPKDFRQALPALAINAHMFAETPADRRVVLNMRGYGEGTRLENGIQIVAITRDGVVMSYQGQRFQIPR